MQTQADSLRQTPHTRTDDHDLLSHSRFLCQQSSPVVQVVSLFPLFPGTNEMDQIEKIHAITGTPSPEILATMKRRSTHVEFDFPLKVPPCFGFLYHNLCSVRLLQSAVVRLTKTHRVQLLPVP